MAASRLPYRCGGYGVLRAAPLTDLALPAWPDFAADSRPAVDDLSGWIGEVWAIDAVAAAVEHASPGLANDVESLSPATSARQVRRVSLSLARYVLRMTGRATPFGLFAGVARVSFGPQPMVSWGSRHRLVGRPDASWLAGLVARLEGCPALLARLPVVASATAFVRGDRLVVPFPALHRGTGVRTSAEVSLRYTPAVRLAMDGAQAPVLSGDLAHQLAERFPEAGPSRAAVLVADLVGQRALVSSLHAPATTIDAFGHLMRELEAAGGDEIAETAALMADLCSLGTTLYGHNAATTPTRDERRAIVSTMASMVPEARRPLAVDMEVDCAAVLPTPVQREAERAAAVLVRLSVDPTGTAAWRAYHDRFFERYGLGSLVPIREVVDPDAGLGYPAGYLGGPPAVPKPLPHRDRTLFALAQAAALDGQRELVLNDALVAELAPSVADQVLMPAHVELRFQLHANSLDAVAQGAFTLWDPSVSRGVGTLLGRAAAVLDPDRTARGGNPVAGLPTRDAGALPVQLSFPPLDAANAHVARAPALLAVLVALGEHRAPSAGTIALDDLVVGCDRRHLYLASLSRGRRLQPLVCHALDLRAHTPPLARFLAELTNAGAAVVTGFDWGAAAELPFLPRVRSGRTVLSPARWRLAAADLPAGASEAHSWYRALAEWREWRGVPRHVQLAESDQLLPLDLEEVAHGELLRAHFASAEHAGLVEAPGPGTSGWLDGHTHEVVVPMTSTATPRPAHHPPIRASQVIGRDHGHIPGASPWLHVKLYGSAEHQPTLIGHRLPGLLAAWDEPPMWWFTRYRDPEPHIRLRIALADTADFSAAAQRVGLWVEELRHEGLLRDVQIATTYPEEGRWGSGPAMAAAEAVFASDSACLATQFAQRAGPHRQVLAAANFVAISCGFTGSVDAGMEWLLDHARTAPTPAAPRSILGDTVRLADPTSDWAALRNRPGGAAIAEPWAARDKALAAYRAEVERPSCVVDTNLVLESLLHTHHIRAAGIEKDDERTCMRLARAVALAWNARERQDSTR